MHMLTHLRQQVSARGGLNFLAEVNMPNTKNIQKVKDISDDFIHPSKKGIELISQVIADYIFNNKVFPK